MKRLKRFNENKIVPNKNTPVIEKQTINVEITVETNKSKSDTEAAIKKGVYWGLDVKNVSTPKEVNVKFGSDINEYNGNVTRSNVARFEEGRERKEIIDHLVRIIRRGTLDQLRSWKSILGW